LLFLGDLTDAKDYHSSSLVNGVVAGIQRLRTLVPSIRILMGNHDYLRRDHAYFAFLSAIPGVRFITRPWDDMGETSDGPACMFLPHTRTPSKDWATLDLETHFTYVFMHQTVGGSVASNGMKMEDEGVPEIKGPKVYSGDIHVPQVIKGVEYVGSPYHVHFGDDFKPRCLLLDKRNRPVDLSTVGVFPRRVKVKVETLRQLKQLKDKLERGDHVKLHITLDAADAHDWARIKREAMSWLDGVGAEVHGIGLEVRASAASIADLSAPKPKWFSDDEVVEQFVRAEDLGADVLEAGLRAMK
jgi:hypothetical protein